MFPLLFFLVSVFRVDQAVSSGRTGAIPVLSGALTAATDLLFGRTKKGTIVRVSGCLGDTRPKRTARGNPAWGE
jgi:hypothetical protein